MNKLHLLLILMLSLMAFSVMAEGEYYNPNYNDNNRDIGLFNTELADITAVSKGVSDGYLVPLVGDIDGDGSNEIVVAEGTTVSIFESKSLTEYVGYPVGYTIQHMILHNMTADNKLQIITIGGTKVSIVEHNGTSTYLIRNHTISNIASTTEEFMVGCKGIEQCLLVNGNQQQSVNNNIYVEQFNTTHIFNSTQIKNNINSGNYYLPNIRSVEIADYDEDGETEYIFTAFGYSNTNLCIWWISANGTVSGINEEYEECFSASDIFADTGRDDFTSPSVYNYDHGSHGLETVVAYQDGGTDDFVIEMFDDGYGDNDIDSLDTFFTFTDDGTIISPIMRMTAFSDSGVDNDFCVLGFETADNEVNLLCGSMISTDLFGLSGNEYLVTYDGASYYDLIETPLASDSHVYDNMAQASQMSNRLYDGTNRDEIVSTFGVFRINPDDDTLDLIYDIPYSFGAPLAADVEEAGREDILYLTSTAIWYIDDGFTNNPGEIDTVKFNPCYDAVWKVNTTISITVKYYDDEGDLGNVQAILYYGDANQQDSGWSPNISSGTSQTFNFVANKTGAYTLRVLARDTENPTINDTLDRAFTVSTDGVTLGDTTCTDDETTAADTAAAAAAAATTTGAGLTDEEIEATIGILWTSNSKLKLMLGLIIVIMIMIRVATYTQSPQVILGSGFIGLIISVSLTLVDAWIMILAMLALGIILFLGNRISGGGNGSNSG